jgi:phosphoribosyl 1,2-cyclic phosphodiesterase
VEFASLGSGSKGNATIIRAQDTVIMIDCGFSMKETEIRLARLDLSPTDLSAILVTHEHGDHIKGVAALSRKYGMPAFMTHGTARAKSLLDLATLSLICSHQPFEIGALTVQPVVVPHDSNEPVQYVVSHEARKLGLLTDLGSFTPHVVAHYAKCQALLLECNHDLEMLRVGPYPPSLKRRVAGDFGHLNNQQAAALLAEVNHSDLQHLVVSHISEQNNDPQLALNELERVIDQDRDWIVLADQEQGFSWRTIV